MQTAEAFPLLVDRRRRAGIQPAVAIPDELQRAARCARQVKVPVQRRVPVEVMVDRLSRDERVRRSIGNVAQSDRRVSPEDAVRQQRVLGNAGSLEAAAK